MVRKLFAIMTCSVVAASCAGNARMLPPLQPADEVRVMEGATEVVRIADAATVASVIELVNAYRSGWGVPWYGPPVAKTQVVFYSSGEFVGEFGLGDGFFTRTYGDFYSRPATDDELAKVRTALGLKRL